MQHHNKSQNKVFAKALDISIRITSYYVEIIKKQHDKIITNQAKNLPKYIDCTAKMFSFLGQFLKQSSLLPFTPPRLVIENHSTSLCHLTIYHKAMFLYGLYQSKL